MSKKHFIALADALRYTKPSGWNSEERLAQWERDVEAILQVCRDGNPAFKSGRWLDYINGLCGPNGGVK